MQMRIAVLLVSVILYESLERLRGATDDTQAEAKFTPHDATQYMF